MPNQPKEGKEQFNAWLDPDTVDYVKDIMRRKQMNKSDAVRFLLREGIDAYRTSKDEHSAGPEAEE